MCKREWHVQILTDERSLRPPSRMISICEAFVCLLCLHEGSPSTKCLLAYDCWHKGLDARKVRAAEGASRVPSLGAPRAIMMAVWKSRVDITSDPCATRHVRYCNVCTGIAEGMRRGVAQGARWGMTRPWHVATLS